MIWSTFALIDGAEFGLLCLGFSITGYLINKNLWGINENIFAIPKHKFTISVFIISLPFFIRSFYNIVANSILEVEYSNFKAESIKFDTWAAPLIDFFYICLAD